MPYFQQATMCKFSPHFGAFREPPENEHDTSQKKSCKKVLTPLAQGAYVPDVRKKSYTAAEVINLLKKMQGDQSDARFAHELGITPAYLCDLYKGRRTPGEKILSRLRLVKKVADPVYEAVSA